MIKVRSLFHQKNVRISSIEEIQGTGDKVGQEMHVILDVSLITCSPFAGWALATVFHCTRKLQVS